MYSCASFYQRDFYRPDMQTRNERTPQLRSKKDSALQISCHTGTFSRRVEWCPSVRLLLYGRCPLVPKCRVIVALFWPGSQTRHSHMFLLLLLLPAPQPCRPSSDFPYYKVSAYTSIYTVALRSFGILMGDDAPGLRIPDVPRLAWCCTVSRKIMTCLSISASSTRKSKSSRKQKPEKMQLASHNFF